jgi:predicted esterase
MAGPHRLEGAISYGTPLAQAKAAVILVHGRGATAESMLPLADAIGVPDIAYIAPKATGNVWYPNSFLAPIASNEPWLSSALALLAALVERLGTEGMRPERVGFVGFSQGACLSTEFSARQPRRYGFIAGLSGGLIGPPGIVWNYDGSLAGTPVLLGCSDIDPHIPLERVKESTQVLKRLGAEVDERLYPGMGHTVNEDEIEVVRELLRGVVGMPS